MLGEDDHQDVRNLVTKADKLWALHGQKISLVASVDQLEEDSAVIAASSLNSLNSLSSPPAALRQ